MKKLMFFWMCTFILMLLGISGAFSQAASLKGEAIDILGQVDNGLYKNSYFGIQLSVLNDWHLIDKTTTTATINIGADVLKTQNERTNKLLQDSINHEVVLLSFSKKPIGSFENAMFMMAVVKQPSPSVLPSMVAEATKSVFANNPNVKVVKDTRQTFIAGKKFAVVDFALTVMDHTANIKFYVTVINGFALTFSLSYVDGADLVELEKVVASMKFSGK